MTAHRKSDARPVRNGVPIQIGRHWFPSIRACAAHFGVSPAAVSKRLDAGTLDRLLLPAGQRRRRPDQCRPDQRRPVQVGARRFASVQDCAAHLGVSVTTVRRHATAGTLDRLLLDYHKRQMRAAGVI